MMDNWEIQALIAAVTVFVAHKFLVDGFHEQIPLSSVDSSVGAGLAVLAAVGVGINAYAYSEM